MAERELPKESELYKRCDEVLHYIWDPIGVAGCPEARDEYYSYLPHVLRLLQENAGTEEIAEYLVNIEENMMRLAGNRPRALAAAETLLRWKARVDMKENI